MSVLSGLQLRFHNWAVIVLLCFVGAITASILMVVNSKFETMAFDHAGQSLRLILQNATERLTNLVDGTCRDVAVQAGAGRLFLRDEHVTERDIERIFLARLAGEESLYSIYVGFDNDDFLQAVSTGGDPNLAASLAAPPETRFAVRSIIRTKEGKRVFPATNSRSPRTISWIRMGTSPPAAARMLRKAARTSASDASRRVIKPLPLLCGIRHEQALAATG